VSISNKFQTKTGYIRLTDIELISLWQTSSDTRDFVKRLRSLQKEYVIQKITPSTYRDFERYIEEYEWHLSRAAEWPGSKRFVEVYSDYRGYERWLARTYIFASVESHRARIRNLKRNGVSSLKHLRTVREKSPTPDYATLNNHAANLLTT